MLVDRQALLQFLLRVSLCELQLAVWGDYFNIDSAKNINVNMTSYFVCQSGNISLSLSDNPLVISM